MILTLSYRKISFILSFLVIASCDQKISHVIEGYFTGDENKSQNETSNDALYLLDDTFDFTYGMQPSKPELWKDWAFSNGSPSEDVIKSSRDCLVLIIQKKYEEVDSYLDEITKKYFQGEMDEYWLNQAMQRCSWNQADELDLVNRWVEETGSAFSYQSKALTLTNIGSRIRGGAYAHKTSSDKMYEFHRYLELSLEDSKVALSKDSRLLSTYSNIFSIAGAYSRYTEETERYLGIMEKKIPQAYYPRKIILNHMKPRWGGSYKEMRAFAENAQRFTNLNPRLRYLIGEEWIDRADRLMESGQIDLAVKNYSRGIYHGVFTSWLSKRAYAYGELNDLKNQKEDFITVLKVIPNESYAWLGLAKAYRNEGDYDNAKSTMERYVKAFPHHKTGWIEIGFLSLQLEEYATAQSYFKRASELDPSDTYVSYQIVYLGYMLHDVETQHFVENYIKLCDLKECDEDSKSWVHELKSCIRFREKCENEVGRMLHDRIGSA